MIELGATQDLVNIQISQLRGFRVEHNPDGKYWWLYPPKGDSVLQSDVTFDAYPGMSEENAWLGAPDWHDDMNWPRLFRELPQPHLWQHPNGTWACDPDQPGDFYEEYGRTYPTPQDAVCANWIFWKLHFDMDVRLRHYVFNRWHDLLARLAKHD